MDAFRVSSARSDRMAGIFGKRRSRFLLHARARRVTQQKYQPLEQNQTHHNTIQESPESFYQQTEQLNSPIYRGKR